MFWFLERLHPEASYSPYGSIKLGFLQGPQTCPSLGLGAITWEWAFAGVEPKQAPMTVGILGLIDEYVGFI